MKYIRQCPYLFLLVITSVVYLVTDRIEIQGISAQTWAVNHISAAMGAMRQHVWEKQEDKEVSGSVSGNGEESAMLPEGNRISTEGEDEEETQQKESIIDMDGEESLGQQETIEEAPRKTLYTYEPVTEEYFQDALFIGDSRTVGLSQYSGWEEATFYAEKGLTIYKLFDMPMVETEESKQKLTIEEALTKYRFGKIYLMIGINEMGVGTVDSFMEEYTQAVAHLQELQPDAIIYLEGIIRVSTARSEKGDYINNQSIQERNERIAELADNQNIFYLDANPALCDETGGLTADYTFDGVHLRAEYMCVWTDFLLQNGIVKEKEHP